MKKAMTQTLKPGDKLQHEGKEWIITEIGEDNEGEVVYHLKQGNELSVVKESYLPNETVPQEHHAPRSGDR